MLLQNKGFLCFFPPLPSKCVKVVAIFVLQQWSVQSCFPAVQKRFAILCGFTIECQCQKCYPLYSDFFF